MEQSPHSSGGSEIFTNDQQGSEHEYYQVMILFKRCLGVRASGVGVGKV